ncbi:hypothetical protein [Paracidovorax konjaci]|uniref:Uncharacterized protein n=1 Tax=Paracidovorax konjaci TaxID=32040 RepID=A0A1I1U0F5_9BURK|nr:hypothetical protein [Paracidovorax konjaci]SFD63078.1 hypothetical protein SAMN04489710_104124 [Paracidovorax konjaci]
MAKLTQPMDCLVYCQFGMTEQLLDFAKSTSGQNYLRMSKRLLPDAESRLKAFLVDYQSTFLVKAIALTMGVEADFDLVTSPPFMEMHHELCDTVDEHIGELMALLTDDQRSRLQALLA